MQLFVIITVQATIGNQTTARTFQGDLTAPNDVTARAVYDHVWNEFVPQEFHRTGVVLYYAATPAQPWN